MKILLLLSILFIVTSCQGEEQKQVVTKTKEECTDNHQVLLTKVNGCSVYRVYYEYWDQDGCNLINYKNLHWNANFLYTSCPKDSVKWDCGKHCTQTNTTQTEE